VDQTLSCTSCGRQVFADSAFCSHCGTRIGQRNPNTSHVRRTQMGEWPRSGEPLACGSCNSPLLPGEVFCPACGARHGARPQEARPADQLRAAHLRKLEESTRGRFEFLRELGRGGMGTVYLAREIDLDRLVAIKVLASNWLTDDAMVERFRREARTIASLRHPSIVHIHGVGQLDDVNYFIMDFIDGVSLSKVLRSHGRLSIAASQAILYQVGSALSYAHRSNRGVIHRDIKPGNIMLDAEGNSFVTDFGISKVAESPSSGLTMTGLIMGTPEYMSPEQCRGDTVTYASDQYALGAVVYAMLSGAPPFTGPDYRVLMGHTTEQALPIQQLRPDCPDELARVVMRMLAKAPADRFGDIKDALKATGVRPLLPDDPIRDELMRLVADSQSIRRAEKRLLATGPSGGEATPTSVRILLPPQLLEPGDEIDLRATAVLANGEETESGEILWESEDPSIARIDPTTGRLVAVGVGSAVIRARTASVAESVAIEIGTPRVVQLTIVPAVFELEVGATQQLTTEPRGRRGQILTRTVLWSSSDPQTAGISEQGLVRAHHVGSASLLAHCDGVGATSNVKVIAPRVASVRIVGVPASLGVGSASPLRAEARDARGARLERPIDWSTSDPAVARIGADGVLHALARGQVHVIAACEGTSARVSIDVKSAPVVRLNVSEPPVGLVAGDTFHLDARPVDALDRPLEEPVAWAVDNPAVLESLGAGRFKAHDPGNATVSAASGGVTAQIKLHVEKLRAASVTIGPLPQKFQVDDQVQLSVVVRDQRGGLLEQPVRWASNDPWIARVTDAGLLIGASPGDVAITAQCDDAQDSAVVSVMPSEWATVVHRPVKLEPEKTASAGKPPESAARPTPMPGSIHVRVDGRGRRLLWVAALAAVTVLGIWTVANVRPRVEPPQSSQPPVSIEPPARPAVAQLQLSSARGLVDAADDLRLAVGDTLTLSAEPRDSAGRALADVSVSWRSTDTAVASIDSAGRLTARAGGSIRIAAIADGITRELALTVRQPATPLVARRGGPAPVPGDRGGRGAIAQDPRGGGAAVDTTGARAADTLPAQPDGVLRLIIAPWARVLVDGVVRHEEGQRLELPLRPGGHRLQLQNPNMMPVDTTIEIHAGQPTTLRFQLRPRSS
jgi:serine/threonine protein kinase